MINQEINVQIIAYQKLLEDIERRKHSLERKQLYNYHKIYKNLEEFLNECKHNQNINFEKGLENRVNLDYVIERLEDIIGGQNEK